MNEIIKDRLRTTNQTVLGEDRLACIDEACDCLDQNEVIKALDILYAHADKIQQYPAISVVVADLFDVFANAQNPNAEATSSVLLSFRHPETGEMFETNSFTPGVKHVEEEGRMVSKPTFRVTIGDEELVLTEEDIVR